MSRSHLFLALPVLGALLLPLAGCGGGPPRSDTRVVVFGVDGLDPDMLQERIQRGLLPNFRRLLESGGELHSLQTSWPPQSPVAWTNFITGCNPGRHGLYDFVHVDRRSYGVANSMSYTDPVGMALPLFGIRLPLTGGDQHLNRSVRSFWEVLAEAGVPVAVWRIPANFPPPETDALTFPDMGTPDLAGTASGRSFLWTERPDRVQKETDNYVIRQIRVLPDARRPWLRSFISQVRGPDNTLLDLTDLEEEAAAAQRAGDWQRAGELLARIAGERRTSVPLQAYVDRSGEVAHLAVEVDGEWAIADEGGWSNWIPVSFPMAGPMTADGWMRFYFKSAEPIEVYGTPVQIDPWDPVMPVSTPEEASGELADAIGPYYTQGFPDAYVAYKSGVLDTGDFVSQSDTVVAERTRMLNEALRRFDETGGLLFFYLGSLDLRCHMLWHCQDEAHPHREPDDTEYADQIDRIYQQVDQMLGRILDHLEGGPETELLIMSDHGFAPFRRKMHVNDWLLQEGYLVLKEGVEHREDGFYRNGERIGSSLHLYSLDVHGEPLWDQSPVDWSRTRAYAIGFNGVILNRAGREPRGIVTEEQAGPLLEEIREKLLALKDPESGAQVFRRVLPATEVFHGPRTGEAPDLQLGFDVNFGASDESAIGEITGEGVIVDNDSRWSGSHLMDPEVVRGTLIVGSGRKLRRDPRLEDLTATLYAMFGVEPPFEIDGESIF